MIVHNVKTACEGSWIKCLILLLYIDSLHGKPIVKVLPYTNNAMQRYKKNLINKEMGGVFFVWAAWGCPFGRETGGDGGIGRRVPGGSMYLCSREEKAGLRGKGKWVIIIKNTEKFVYLKIFLLLCNAEKVCRGVPFGNIKY